MKPPKGYLTMKEAAHRLGMSYRSLSSWIREKKIESMKPGKERFIAVVELERVARGD